MNWSDSQSLTFAWRLNNNLHVLLRPCRRSAETWKFTFAHSLASLL